MEQINEYITELEKLETNLKKSKGRTYSTSFKNEKLERVNYIQTQIGNFIESSEEEQKSKLLTLNYKELFTRISLLVQNLPIKETETSESAQNIVTMAQFDINVVGKNLQVFKGNYETLEDFLVQSELLHDMLRTEDRELFVKYVYNFKLTAQVRSVMGRSNRPSTLSDLKKLLKDAYPNPRTLQQVLAELGAIRQDRMNIATFREKVALLSEQLVTFEVSAIDNPTQEAKDAIYRMSENMALNVFMKGVNAEYKSMLIASSPRTLNEAVEKCLTMERDSRTSDSNIYRIWRRNNEHVHNSRGANSGFSTFRGNRNRNFVDQRDLHNNYNYSNSNNYAGNYSTNRSYNMSNGYNNNNANAHSRNRGNYSNQRNTNGNSPRANDRNRNRSMQNDRSARNNSQGN